MLRATRYVSVYSGYIYFQNRDRERNCSFSLFLALGAAKKRFRGYNESLVLFAFAPVVVYLCVIVLNAPMHRRASNLMHE